MDMGSGIGKACLTAALIHDFDGIAGVEVLECLAFKSLEVKKRYDDHFAKLKKEVPQFEVFGANFFDKQCDFVNGANLILVDCRAFRPKMMMKVNDRLLMMPENRYAITLSQELGC